MPGSWQQPMTWSQGGPSPSAGNNYVPTLIASMHSALATCQAPGRALWSHPHSRNLRRQAPSSPFSRCGLQLRETALPRAPERVTSGIEAAIQFGLTSKPVLVFTPTSPLSRVPCLDVPHAGDAPYRSLWPLGSSPFPSVPLSPAPATLNSSLFTPWPAPPQAFSV